MKAYHNKPEIKAEYIARVRAHREADQLVQGCGYWRDGKGCAVGCTIHGSSHAAYESELGIPQAIARLQDGIFEGLPKEKAQAWPEQFLEAIAAGADLSQVVDKFLHWLLADSVDGVLRFAKTEKQRQSIEAVGKLYARKIDGEHVTRLEWEAAAAAAFAATAAAAFAANAAAFAATAAAAFADAASADAASAAAAAAAYYAADAAAYYAARKAARIRQSEKLLELLREA